MWRLKILYILIGLLFTTAIPAFGQQTCQGLLERSSLTDFTTKSALNAQRDVYLDSALSLEQKINSTYAASLQFFGSRQASQILDWFKARIKTTISQIEEAKTAEALLKLEGPLKEIKADLAGLQLDVARPIIKKKFEEYEAKNVRDTDDYKLSEDVIGYALPSSIFLYLKKVNTDYRFFKVLDRFAEIDRHFAGTKNTMRKNDALIAILTTVSLDRGLDAQEITRLFVRAYGSAALDNPSSTQSERFRMAIADMSTTLRWNIEDIVKLFVTLNFADTPELRRQILDSP